MREGKGANYSVFAGYPRMDNNTPEDGDRRQDGWETRTARGGARGRLDVVRHASCVFICFFDGAVGSMEDLGRASSASLMIIFVFRQGKACDEPGAVLPALAGGQADGQKQLFFPGAAGGG